MQSRIMALNVKMHPLFSHLIELSKFVNENFVVFVSRHRKIYYVLQNLSSLNNFSYSVMIYFGRYIKTRITISRQCPVGRERVRCVVATQLVEAVERPRSYRLSLQVSPRDNFSHYDWVVVDKNISRKIFSYGNYMYIVEFAMQFHIR